MKVPPSMGEGVLAVRTLLEYTGDDTTRQGLRETPERVMRAFREWFSGYEADPAEVLKVFDDGGEGYTGVLFQGSIPFYSTCEHHLATFHGFAHFAYIPDGRVVGLSKIPRLINVFARRLQVQERLTRQVVDAFMDNVDCRGCGIVVQARHMCMESRGIRIPGTVTTTSDLRGIFLEDPAVKAEFLDLVKNEQAKP